MTSPRLSRESRSAEPVRSGEPSYHAGRRALEILAHFGSRADVEVSQGRVRSYPGLTSAAPNTLAFYELAAKKLTGKHILDVGSGSGAGTRLLCNHFAHVTGVEVDPRAIAFARQYATSAEFVQADLCHGLPLDRVDGAAFIDVLAQVRSPGSTLRSVRACLPSGAPVFVAEVRSYVSQRLAPPLRRAFSARSLSRLFLRTGFAVQEVVRDSGTFLALVATRSDHPDQLALYEGFQWAERGDFAQARTCFARIMATASVELQIEARLGEAELAFASGDGDSAARGFFAVNALAPQDGRGWTGLARLALATSQIEDGLGLAVDAVRREPTEAEPHALAALAAEQLQQPGAFAAWRIAANLAPDDQAIASGLARVAAAQNNIAFAITVFERLRDYGDSLAPEFHVTLAWLLLAEGRKNDAKLEARYAGAVAGEGVTVPGLDELIRAVG